MNTLLAAGMLLFVVVQSAQAAERVLVTSVRPDLYKVSVERKYIKTQSCHAEADKAPAIIDNGRITFVDSGEVCDIQEIVRGH